MVYIPFILIFVSAFFAATGGYLLNIILGMVGLPSILALAFGPVSISASTAFMWPWSAAIWVALPAYLLSASRLYRTLWA